MLYVESEWWLRTSSTIVSKIRQCGVPKTSRRYGALNEGQHTLIGIGSVDILTAIICYGINEDRI